jgi:protein-disulfide isomerase-like protein with CxxC motif
MFDCIESFYNRSRRHYSLGCSQTSDAYLAQIAASVGLTLATFDTVIPSSHLIA